jgi:hypothetical protein
MVTQSDLETLRTQTVKIVMATVTRARPYAIDTIEAMFNADNIAMQQIAPVTLFVGSPDVQYLNIFDDDPRVKIVPTSDTEWERIKSWPVRRKAAWNLCRAISSEHTVGDVILCEDDIVFSPSWLTRLVESASALVHAHGPNVALSAYRVYDHWKQENATPLYGQYPGPFYASLCVYLPDAARKRVIEHATRVAVETGDCPFDLALGQTPDMTFWSPLCSLVDHVGDVSTIGGTSVRQAFDFSTT